MRRRFVYLQSFFAFILLLAVASDVSAFTYSFQSSGGAETVTHPIGYDGTGGNLTITYGIRTGSPNATEMQIPLQNAIYTWNQLQPTLDNFTGGVLASGTYDFESVLLHEMGHSLGLSHPNIGSGQGLTGSDMDYTKSTKGTNGSYDIDPGTDTVIGSSDDVRGDDINLNWFLMSSNDPFTIAATVDSTTYSSDIANLPGGHLYSANASRDVGTLLGYTDSEAVMQQGTYSTEVQRDLGHDDVAGILYAMAGKDEVAGTADDYTITLQYVGMDQGADILIGFDNNETTFAQTNLGGTGLGDSHYSVTSAPIYFNTTYTWYFNDTLIPEPGTLFLLAAGGFTLFVRRKLSKYRAKKF